MSHTKFCRFLLAVAAMSAVHAWTLPKTTTTSTAANLGAASLSRQEMLQSIVGFAGAATTIMVSRPLPVFAATTPAGVQYEVIKSGNGPKPEIGELVAIRFSAYAGSNKIDDIFDTPEPYYTRLGSGGLLKGVETTLPLMRLGDRWKLTIPADLAFGKQGRPASAGKPRIPGDAVIVFEVEMVGLPGKEPELIELIGDVDE